MSVPESPESPEGPDGPEAPEARSLLARVIGPALAGEIAPDGSLRLAGVGSGELIRLSLLVEEACDSELSEDEVHSLQTLQSIDLLIARHRGAPSATPDQGRG